MMAVEGIEMKMSAVSAKRSIPAKIKGTKIYGPGRLFSDAVNITSTLLCGKDKIAITHGKVFPERIGNIPHC